MSSDTDIHGDGDNHADSHADAAPAHSTLQGYLTGFLLAVILTAIPFWLVMRHGGGAGGLDAAESNRTALIILGFAAVQIVVHMIYFLHMNTRSEGGWTMLALVFTLVLVVITLSGSIWVMYHLNHNMMPAMMPGMHDMP